MWKIIKKTVLTLFLLACGGALVFFVYGSEPKLNKSPHHINTPEFFAKYPFRLGLDLSGGSHLIYRADVSAVSNSEVDNAMEALRDVIERRVNLFGVSEPVVQVQSGSIVEGNEQKLIVDLPGVTDIEEATKVIGQTPLLEFKIEKGADEVQEAKVGKDGKIELNVDSQFKPTDLTGRYLKRATLEFDQNTRDPRVALQFDDEGTKLFAEITKANVGKIVAIYLDGAPISTPVVRDAILDGQAVISGGFNPTEAKQLVGRLNSGALPVPITLISKQTIGASLGESAVNAGVKAAVVGFLLIALFLIIWYRLPGIVAVVSLSFFILIMLALFKFMPVTLTAAGIAGFIISMGIAVDANVLVFERIKEELKLGRTIADAVRTGFDRAWFSIRDSNISSILTALILFWFGTSLIKGFALTLGLGVLISMFSAIVLTKVFLNLLAMMKENKFTRFLFSSGISSGISK